jgi:hypothetical protein
MAMDFQRRNLVTLSLIALVSRWDFCIKSLIPNTKVGRA